MNEALLGYHKEEGWGGEQLYMGPGFPTSDLHLWLNTQWSSMGNIVVAIKIHHNSPCLNLHREEKALSRAHCNFWCNIHSPSFIWWLVCSVQIWTALSTRCDWYLQLKRCVDVCGSSGRSFAWSSLTLLHLIASFALHYISFSKDLSSKQTSTCVYRWYMWNNGLMSDKQQLSDARHFKELINEDKRHCNFIVDALERKWPGVCSHRSARRSANNLLTLITKLTSSVHIQRS